MKKLILTTSMILVYCCAFSQKTDIPPQNFVALCKIPRENIVDSIGNTLYSEYQLNVRPLSLFFKNITFYPNKNLLEIYGGASISGTGPDTILTNSVTVFLGKLHNDTLTNLRAIANEDIFTAKKEIYFKGLVDSNDVMIFTGSNYIPRIFFIGKCLKYGSK